MTIALQQKKNTVIRLPLDKFSHGWTRKVARLRAFTKFTDTMKEVNTVLLLPHLHTAELYKYFFYHIVTLAISCSLMQYYSFSKKIKKCTRIILTWIFKSSVNICVCHEINANEQEQVKIFHFKENFLSVSIVKPKK